MCLNCVMCIVCDEPDHFSGCPFQKEQIEWKFFTGRYESEVGQLRLCYVCQHFKTKVA